jgi:hypothetical protein
MAHRLVIHPEVSTPEIAWISANAARVGQPGVLLLSFVVEGSIGSIDVPGKYSSPARADELWKHTCFEAFVRPPTGDAYFEFNFSPSTQWAAYAFTGYRQGMRPLEEAKLSAIDVHVAETLEVTCVLDLSAVSGLPQSGTWRCGLTSVIEERGGRKSYWSLKHPPGKPDFHHADNFTLDLPPPESK